MEYLLKSMLCLVLLLLFHRLFLQQEVLHRFNRFFLLGAIVISFLIPFVIIEIPAEQTIASSEQVIFEIEETQSDFNPSGQTFVDYAPSEPISNSFPWPEVLWMVYGAISLIFLIRFIRNIQVLFDQIHRNAKISFKGIPVVLLNEDTLPYSFLKFIFVSKSDYEEGKFTDAVFQHELTHVKEGHSWDILFVEALLIPLWFHPGLYLARKAIRLNHEFIADQVALKSTSLQAYQQILLSMALVNQRNSLVSSLNFSLTKKRLEMMSKKSNPNWKWLKIMVLVPVLGTMVYVFSEKVTAHQELEKVEQNEVLSSKEIDQDFTLKSDGSFVYQDESYQLSQLPGILEELDKENSIIKITANSEVKMGVIQDFQRVLRETGVNKVKYQSSTGEIELGATKVVKLGPIVNNGERDKYYKNATFFVENEKGELVEKSFDMLSDEEQKMLSFFPSAPEASNPTLEEFVSFKNPQDFAVWLDGKHIQNSELEKIKHSQIVHAFNSFVYPNARSQKFPQEHQVSLYTKEGFEKIYGPTSGFGDPLTKEDKLYLYPSENRVNRGMPWPKKNDSPVAEYQEKLKFYELERNLQPHFINRSEAEQQKLLAQFSELGSLYYRIPLELKQTAKRPVHPYAPFVKLESENEVYYKLWEDLTEDEKSQLPPPPQSASIDKVTSYQQVFLKYELLRQEGRKYSTKPNSDRDLMFELFNNLQEQFLSLNPIQRRQVKRVNFPYIPMVENGVLSFKVLDELTPEQRALNNC